MSYCRWSSMNWRCDLYCYEHVNGGYTIHVAANRVVGDIPPEPSWDLVKTEAGREQWLAMRNAVMAFVSTAERKPIGLAHDGETYNEPDLDAFFARLMALREAGYQFPDDVLEAVQGEIRDEYDRHFGQPHHGHREET